MARPGRRPVPTEIKRARGNPGHRPLNDGEPTFAQAKGMPRGRLPAGAKTFWRKYARALEMVGVLKEPDLPAFEMMAWHWHFAVAAGGQIDADGMTVRDPNGDERKHPLLQVFRDNSAAFRMYATEFGMTPSARSRVEAKEEGEQLSLAEMLFAEISEVGEVGQDGR